MKKYIFMALLGLSLSVPKAHAQWVVTDPCNVLELVDNFGFLISFFFDKFIC